MRPDRSISALNVVACVRARGQRGEGGGEEKDPRIIVYLEEHNTREKNMSPNIVVYSLGIRERMDKGPRMTVPIHSERTPGKGKFRPTVAAYLEEHETKFRIRPLRLPQQST